jgi:hypothetical protein
VSTASREVVALRIDERRLDLKRSAFCQRQPNS